MRALICLAAVLAASCEDTRRAADDRGRVRDEVVRAAPSVAVTKVKRCTDYDCLPDVSFTEYGGTVHPRTDLDGKVVVLSVWATWCVSCRETIDTLSRLHVLHHGTGLRVLGLSQDYLDVGQAADARRNLGMTYPVVDLDEAVFGVPVELPTTWIYDRTGRRVRTFDGPATPRELEDAIWGALTAP